MKRKIIYTLVLAAVMATSCRKESSLNPKSVNAVDFESSFSTPDRIKAQVLGIYSGLKANDFYGGRYIVYNEVRADNYINLTTNAVTAYQVWNFTTSNNAQEVTGFWNAAYSVINRCNLFIDGMAAGGAATVGTALAANYVGEAKMVRAIAYYSLLQLYARPYWDGNGSKPGLPLRLKGNSGAGDYDLARSTVGQIYTQILADLNDAEAALPLSYTAAYDNTVRGHRNTAIAFKTRVYLSMQRYTDVITEANKIVSSSAPYTATTGVANALQANVANVYKTPYTTTESILSSPMTVGADIVGGQNALGSYFFSVREYKLNDAGIVADAGWKTTDARRALITSATVANVPSQLMAKFPSSPYSDYVPVIRYAEVLLSLGEAIARSTNSIDARAISLLNAVRQRSDATTTFTAANFATPQALFDAFLKERNIEFLGEGLRSPDLLRLGLDLPAKGTVSAVPASDRRYIFPISQSELLYNRLMTDN
ncbi:RagB/SusD family nutrient uptake outer membrane protein [Pedobacter jejuensis]|uniref:RagB/SusD family nutrient uptake outer membrane protein n=1 Tax=Pedobacter jejuensis TaxID=1268550 RepID=A0A3N0BWX2_9SPHI|nr:RagB/SusD family nutrient uptake outer membrane protein [Pedobacter jejuensis]RNL54138.1 RagB/SusD family nutrient uptake outer membrane protein [Pedobacter jejuensis]